MQPNIVITNSKVPPRLRTAVTPLALGQGEFSNLANIRTDTTSVVVRQPELLINANPPPGSTGVILGLWSGEINGTTYIVSAWVMNDVANTVALFYQNAANGWNVYSEITNKGNNSNASSWGGDSHGKSRFTHTSARVAFSVQSTPRHVANGAVSPSYDILVCSNGTTDPPIVWNQGNGFSTYSNLIWAQWVQSIITPPSANSFTPIATMSAFWAIWGTTRPTYASGTIGGHLVNSATHFAMADSTATYTGSNAVVKLVLGSSANTGMNSTNCDIATAEFSTGPKFLGPYLAVIIEGSSSDINTVLKDARIDLGKGTGGTAYGSVATWSTIYDATSTDPSLNQLPPLIALDSGNTRWMLQFPLTSITTQANRQCDNIRFLWMGATAPGSAITLEVLGIMSTGIGGGYPYGTFWTAVFEDFYSFAESPPFTQNGITSADYLSSVGGPRGPDASLATPIILPQNSSVFYDYILPIRNSITASPINGGLQGNPSHVSFYFNTPQEIAASLQTGIPATPFFFTNVEIWTPVGTSPRQWSNGTTANTSLWGNAAVLNIKTNAITASDGYTFGYNSFATVDYLQRDPGVPAPSDFNEVIPSANVLFGADNRLFVGNTAYATGNIPGELKFSDRGFFGRMRSIGDPTDVFAGSRLVFDGETITAGTITAAAAQGATTIYIWTDKSFNALGTSGGSTFIGSGIDASTLGTRFRISTDGTLSPNSIAEYNSVLFWVTNHGEIARFDQGALAHISYKQVTNSGSTGDIIAAVPSARRTDMVGVFNRQRYYLFLTPEDGTENTTCLVWNEPSMGRSMWGFDQPMGEGYWESLDTVDNAELATAFFDSTQNGAGRRLFVYSQTGGLQAYEEGTGHTAFAMSSRGVQAVEVLADAWQPGSGFSIQEIETICTQDQGASLYIDVYPNMGTDSYGFNISIDADDQSEWIAKTQLNNQDTSRVGWSCYFNVHGSLTGGTIIYHIAAFPTIDMADNRKNA